MAASCTSGWLRLLERGLSQTLVGGFVRRVGVRRILARVERIEKHLAKLSDSGLQDTAKGIAFRARRCERAESFLPEAYAVVRESSKRVLGMRHYAVQVRAAVFLAGPCVVEMATGEGKSLTATMPLVLYTFQGGSAHLATSNDYLASRDCEQFRPLYEFLGLTVGTITSHATADASSVVNDDVTNCIFCWEMIGKKCFFVGR